MTTAQAIASADRPARRVEQRQFHRRNVLLRCWLSDGKVDRYASLVDISADGARVLTVAPPPTTAMVTLRLRLPPGDEEISAVARVVWRSEGFRGRGGVLGMQFAQIAGLTELTAFVKEG